MVLYKIKIIFKIVFKTIFKIFKDKFFRLEFIFKGAFISFMKALKQIIFEIKNIKFNQKFKSIVKFCSLKKIWYKKFKDL